MSYLPSLIVSRPPATNPLNFGLVYGNNLFIEEPVYNLTKLNKTTFATEASFAYSLNKNVKGDLVTDGTSVYALTAFSNGLGDTDYEIIKVAIAPFNAVSALYSFTSTADAAGPVGDHTIFYDTGFVYFASCRDQAPRSITIKRLDTATLGVDYSVTQAVGGASGPILCNTFLSSLNEIWVIYMDNLWSYRANFDKATGAYLYGGSTGKRIPYAAQDGDIVYGTDKLNFGAATNAGNPYINVFNMTDYTSTWYNIDSRLANYHCRGIWVDGDSIYLKVYEVTNVPNGDGNIYLWRLNKNRLTDTVRDHVFLGAVTGFGANEGV